MNIDLKFSFEEEKERKKMSENSFENSTYSENNSYDEVSSNPAESSLGSPSNQRIEEDFSGGGGGGTAFGPRLSADMMTSLPVLSTTSPYVTTMVIKYNETD